MEIFATILTSLMPRKGGSYFCNSKMQGYLRGGTDLVEYGMCENYPKQIILGVLIPTEIMTLKIKLKSFLTLKEHRNLNENYL